MMPDSVQNVQFITAGAKGNFQKQKPVGCVNFSFIRWQIFYRKHLFIYFVRLKQVL